MLAGTTLVANSGNSRWFVSRNGVAVEIFADHKDEYDIELKRIQNTGAKVTPDVRGQ
jgi:hypothetical protein